MQHTSPLLGRIADMPVHAQGFISGINITKYVDTYTFVDYLGRFVNYPTMGMKKPPYHVGYAKACWDYLNGNMLLSANNTTLWVRDKDTHENPQLLTSWHPIASLEAEYHVPARETVLGWQLVLTNECSKLTKRVRRGVRFGTTVFERTENGVEQYTLLESENDNAYELTLPDNPGDKWAREAYDWSSWLTQDRHSADNLIRMFATPFLEKYKHLTYIIYGGGGNGKGIIINNLISHFPNRATSFDTKRFSTNSGFISEQEGRKLLGKAWAFDEEADILDENNMTSVKRLSTGDTITARGIGENAVAFNNQATLIIATNNPVVSEITEASNRRFVLVRMQDGRRESEFPPFISWVNTHGIAAFLYASCVLWTHTENTWKDISIGDVTDLTDVEQWAADSIVVNGYAVSQDNPVTKRFSKTSMNKLGLKTALKRVGDKVTRVIIVDDERRFHPYRQGVEKDFNKLNTLHEVVDIPTPIDPQPEGDATTFGFQADYVEASPDKIAYKWKEKTLDDHTDTRYKPTTDVYAVIPKPGYLVLDFDIDKQNVSGWALFNQQVASYGDDAFPSTYLVQTPSGGVHAYYQIPKEYRGKIKNAAHPHGLPIDIRCEQKGYVIGAGSTTKNGTYKVVDMPETPEVPTLTPDMLTWLSVDGYVESAYQRSQVLHKFGVRGLSIDRPDMSIIGEGERNQKLHDWAYGRLYNHPENEEKIHADLIDRGVRSGLQEQELETIWTSITNNLIQNGRLS